MAEEHTGELLFHCWQHSDPARAYAQFESIVNHGFLLTINANGLDSFQYFADGNLTTIDVMQKARVCFTEIPAHLLHTHNYGHFGIGFQRKTIIEWGGCPAWYLPNHAGTTSLKEMGPALVRGFHASAVAIADLEALVRDIPAQLKQHIPEKYLSRDFEIGLNFTHGNPLRGAALLNWLEQNREVIYHPLSYVKELSPRDIEDYRYLYEREWRIVDGAQYKGKSVCRPLTDTEVTQLAIGRPAWLEKLVSSDINVTIRYPNSRIIDHFRFFNGIGADTVAQRIDTILVPDRAAKRYVKTFIKRNRAAFKDGGPRIRLFPSTFVRRFAWSAGRLLKTATAGSL
jgi:hypothetical protein